VKKGLGLVRGDTDKNSTGAGALGVGASVGTDTGH